ncbi:hypothetical protein YC2023_047037 [Brassica napus]
MNHHHRRESFSVTISNMGGGSTVLCPNTDLLWPFGKLNGLEPDDIRETAYEIFFTACRSSPGFGGKTALTFYSTHNNNDNHGEAGGGGGGGSNGGGSGSGFGFSGRKEVVTTPTSRVKRALGLKMLKRSPSRRMSTIGVAGGAGVNSLSPGGGSGSGHISPGAGDETLVLDEIDEMLELMKKTWLTLGITRPVHNLCFTWVLFHQYVVTSQMEPDLLGASHAMLAEVANDAKKLDREALYVKLLTSVLASMQGWTEKRLLSYHDYFQRGNVGLIENLLPLALSSSRILGEDVTISQGKGDVKLIDYSGDRRSFISRDTVEVLQTAGKLEKVLVQMVAEDSEEFDDGGKGLVQEMVPYEVDSIILRLLRQWIEENLKRVQECLFRAKETETWNPKSKSEPYAQSAGELMKLAKEIIDEFFEIPIGITEDLVHDLVEGLEQLFQEYTTFVASCGSRQSYIPTLPPLTRCNRDSGFLKLWKRATLCTAVREDFSHVAPALSDSHHARPSTSRGTQRLYIRLNTLHFLSSHIHSLNKTLSLNPRVLPATRKRYRHRSNNSSSYFDFTYAGIESACQHVSEVAAYRLIFLDSNSVLYESLYVGEVMNTRIRPALRVMKQNLTLMSAILADRAQALAMREVMKSSFEAFLMVLLAGGFSRVFYRSDHSLIEEDFESLKRVFCTCGEGLIPEDIVDRDAESVEGVIQLMSQPTEQLMEDFSIVTCETSGMGMVGSRQKLPMPPTTGRWNRSDPKTILRVLCHRNDRVANQFLKKSFQLPKRSDFSCAEQCFLCVIITYLSMISEKKYPDPVLEEPILAFDPLSAALTMISCSENSSQGLSERSQYRAIAEW